MRVSSYFTALEYTIYVYFIICYHNDDQLRIM